MGYGFIHVLASPHKKRIPRISEKETMALFGRHLEEKKIELDTLQESLQNFKQWRISKASIPVQTQNYTVTNYGIQEKEDLKQKHPYLKGCEQTSPVHVPPM